MTNSIPELINGPDKGALSRVHFRMGYTKHQL